MSNTFHDPIPEAFQNVIRTTLEMVQARSPYSDEEIHSIRVATKKLRALLKIYAMANIKLPVKKLESEIKALADIYAFSRDALAINQTLLEQTNTKDCDQAMSIRELQSLILRRRELMKPETPVLKLDEKLSSIDRIRGDTLLFAKRSQFKRGLNRSYKKAIKLIRKAEFSQSEEDYHSCRKWIKYYLYQQKLLFNNTGATNKNKIKILENLSDVLGRLNDLRLLSEELNILRKKRLIKGQELKCTNLLLLDDIEIQKQEIKSHCHSLFEKAFGLNC